MSDKKSTQKKSNKMSKKCKIKCKTCQFYDYEDDYCTERDIESCTKQTNLNFSKCPDFLIRDKFVLF